MKIGDFMKYEGHFQVAAHYPHYPINIYSSPVLTLPRYKVKLALHIHHSNTRKITLYLAVYPLDCNLIQGKWCCL